MNNFLPQVSYLWLVRNERTPILLCWTSLVIGRKRLGGPGWVRCSVNKSDYYYEQFNFRLAPQTFMLVTSSNSLPEGQPHLFTFVSPWISGVFLNQAFSSDLKNRCQQVSIGRYTSIQGGVHQVRSIGQIDRLWARLSHQFARLFSSSLLTLFHKKN